MKRSFLNMITVDGKEIRLAEFGFFADSPSFDGEAVIFRKGNKYMSFNLENGMLSPSVPPSQKSCTSPDGKYSVHLNFTSELTDGCEYSEMILHDIDAGTEKVLVRFMGCADSVGNMPFSADSKKIVFFGYPADEFGE